MTQVAEKPQGTLFNINTKAISPYWVDNEQPLLVPENPLHYQAHKLQIMMERLERQAENNPAQFNASVYFNISDKHRQLCEAINKGETKLDEVLDKGGVGKSGNSGATPPMGDPTPPSMDSRIPADNPLAG